MSAATAKTHPLLAKHVELIAKYDVTHGAPKAQVSRQIIETELDMTLEGVEFEGWQKPSAYRASYLLTEDQLRDEIAKLRAVIARDDVSDAVKSAADRRLTKFTDQAGKRNVEV